MAPWTLAALLMTALLAGCATPDEPGLDVAPPTSGKEPARGAKPGTPTSAPPPRPTPPAPSPTTPPPPPPSQPPTGAPPPPPAPPEKAQETWYGAITGGNCESHLSPSLGPDGVCTVITTGIGFGFAFEADLGSAGAPAGTPLHGGIWIAFAQPLATDVVVSLSANGQVVASATHAGPAVHAPIDGPALYALPERTDADIPPGSLLTLSFEVPAPSPGVLDIHSTGSNPTLVVLG